MPLPFPYAYIITYETTQPAEKYQPLLNELMASHKWFRYMTNTWIVLRYDAMVEFQGRLLPLIFNTDRLLIMPAKGPGMGWLPQPAWDWINQNVPKEW
jgi:hypothetical protein